MANNYLITGYHGEPHVTVENDRGLNAATFGKGRFVLPVGEQFRAEYIGNNTIRMYDGKLMDNGAAAGIPAGEYVDLLIANAGQGMNRNDLIVFQYEQDSSTLIESGSFIIVQGTESSGSASDPSLTQQDILSNKASFDQMALYRVPVSGTAISAPVQLFTVAATAGDITPESIGAIPTSQKGTANGVATLDGNGKAIASQSSTSYVTVGGDTALTSGHEGKTLKVTADATLTLGELTDGCEIEIINYGANTVTLSGTLFVAGEGSATACTIDEKSVAVCKYMNEVWFVAGGVSV